MKRQALVCEDNVALRTLVGRLVEAHGWAATMARTAKDAMAMAAQLHPDLVVVDVEFSGLSGLETIPRLRAGWPGARVVAVSASNWAPELCLGVGARAVVTATNLCRLDEVLTDTGACQAA